LAKLNLITSDPAEALRGSDLIFVNVPAVNVDSFIETLAPHFQQGQTIVVTTGYWASLRCQKILQAAGTADKINFAEFTIMPYLCDKDGAAEVHVGNYKRELIMSAFPATKAQAAFETVRKAYPQVKLARDILAVNLQPGNPGVHVQITLPRAAFFFERAKVFRFYGEVSHCASRLTDAHDRERMAIAAALGCETRTWPEYCRAVYEYKGENLYELTATYTDPHQQRWSGVEEAERLLVEDICYSFIPMEQLGKLVGVPTPVTTAMIDLTAVYSGFDYRARGVTLEHLGFGGMSREQILGFVASGVRA
jgi:opine dehydrogenase